MVAKSGGAGIAVRALEWLADDAVERAILLAPAISPRYDLTAALRAVRREIVVFWSPLDVVVLGAGTRLFGTIDRVKTVGAGLVGFRVPACGHVDHFARGPMESSVRCAGKFAWRPAATSAVTWDRILLYSSEGTLCHC